MSISILSLDYHPGRLSVTLYHWTIIFGDCLPCCYQLVTFQRGELHTCGRGAVATKTQHPTPDMGRGVCVARVPVCGGLWNLYQTLAHWRRSQIWPDALASCTWSNFSPVRQRSGAGVGVSWPLRRRRACWRQVGLQNWASARWAKNSTWHT